MGKEFRLKNNIAQTAFLMALLTLGSKALGFLREMAMATFFGANYVVDAYVMSQAIPSILFAGLLGSIATAYMPLLSEKIENVRDTLERLDIAFPNNELLKIKEVCDYTGESYKTVIKKYPFKQHRISKVAFARSIN